MLSERQESPEVEVVVEEVTHIAFIAVEAFAMVLFVLTICGVIWKVYNDRNFPTVVKNRVLFGLLTFGLVVFLMREFADKLSTEVMAFVIGQVWGSVTTIILFLYDKDKEVADVYPVEGEDGGVS